MANVVIVAGPTGSGKSRSTINLNPDITYVINVLDKPLPYKNSKTLYNKDKKNIISVDDYRKIIPILEVVNTKMLNVKHLIIDDIGFIATTEFFDRASEKGFEKFTEIGVHMQRIISYCKNMRPDLDVALLFHEEDDISDKIKVGKKIKLIGQLLEDKYDPLAIVSTALFADVNFNKDSVAEYGFLTQKTQIRGQIIPAKSPEGMFEENKIPNDLNLVFTKMHEYYG